MVFLRFSPTFIGLPRIDFLRREIIRREPPVCFLTVFEIVFLIACLGGFCCPLHPESLVHFVSGALSRYV